MVGRRRFSREPVWWYQPHPLRWCLLPFALLTSLVVRLRRLSYRCGCCASTAWSVPVVVVGNLSVGGTGKSPLTAAIAKACQQQGWTVGLVSRGYGGQAPEWPQWVQADSDPQLVGDEPVMLVRQTGCPMVVGPDRVAAVRALLQRVACDVVVSDDGLQHYALGRDIEIAVVDGVRGHGNGLCLPAGPLREPLSRLKTVDWVVVNGGAETKNYRMDLVLTQPRSLSNSERTLSWDDLRQKPVHAVAGIGNPERFFDALQAQGLEVVPHPFPDHHTFKPADLDFLEEYPILMTAKDAVKCVAWAGQQCWEVGVTARCDSEFLEGLLIQLKVIVPRKNFSV